MLHSIINYQDSLCLQSLTVSERLHKQVIIDFSRSTEHVNDAAGGTKEAKVMVYPQRIQD